MSKFIKKDIVKDPVSDKIIGTEVWAEDEHSGNKHNLAVFIGCYDNDPKIIVSKDGVVIETIPATELDLDADITSTIYNDFSNLLVKFRHTAVDLQLIHEHVRVTHFSLASVSSLPL